jgi:hypothetical protein
MRTTWIGTTMKLVRIDRENIGLLVQLPTGPHTIDIVKSLGIFAAHDPLSGGIINGVLKEKCTWTALVSNWRYLRKPLELLARTALNHPADPRLAIQPFAGERRTADRPRGIVAIEITDATELESHDPTGRLMMARQLSEAADDKIEPGAASMAENVQVVDFSRRDGLRLPRGQV